MVANNPSYLNLKNYSAVDIVDAFYVQYIKLKTKKKRKTDGKQLSCCFPHDHRVHKNERKKYFLNVDHRHLLLALQFALKFFVSLNQPYFYHHYLPWFIRSMLLDLYVPEIDSILAKLKILRLLKVLVNEFFLSSLTIINSFKSKYTLIS